MKSKILGLLAVGLLASPVAMAITYNYVGPQFAYFGDTDGIAGEYTTSMRVTASVTLASELGPGHGTNEITPLAFSLSDGRQTITNLNAQSSAFFFETDATGTIINWGAVAIYTDNEGLERFIGTTVFGIFYDGAYICKPDSNGECKFVFEENDYLDIGVTGQRGAGWTVPEPGTLALLGLGLAGLGLSRRRKAN